MSFLSHDHLSLDFILHPKNQCHVSDYQAMTDQITASFMIINFWKNLGCFQAGKFEEL